MRNKVSVKSLLSLIDPVVLESIAIETNVNYKCKKLSGDIIFKLILMSILDNTKISLRIMEKTFSNPLFKIYSGAKKEETIKFNSISERLSVINSSYFEKIYEHVILVSKKYLSDNSDEYLIRPFDSTSLSISSKLLKKGMVSGVKSKEDEHRKKQIKFTVGLLKDLPVVIDFYNEQAYLGEDLTLSQTILKSNIGNNEIVVFDRGLKKRKIFKEFTDCNIFFVTRINPTKSIKVIKSNPLKENTTTQSLKLISDQEVNLYHEGKSLFKEPFRLIKSVSLKTNEEIFFLTNIKDLSTQEVTEIYKKRWQIEVFFKFIKQHLHFKHFLNYSENGIKVMMYMTMIVAILILIYKKLNEIKNYKTAKYEFTEELNMEIIKEIVVICDGDPNKSPLFNTC
ncbi:MAG: IS4 family transposase [Flavobacterium sp.]